MILKLKYAFAVVSLLLLSSTYLYHVTGRSDCFWEILGLLAFGSCFFSVMFISMACLASKIYKKINIKTADIKP